jgi:hypothetical protein
LSYFSALVRPTPFEFALAPVAEERFPRIRAALAKAERDPKDRVAFLMEREVVVLVRELRPDEGLGERMDQLAALVHQGYLYWDAGEVTIDISPEQLPDLLSPHRVHDLAEPPSAYYARLPERRVWAAVLEGQPSEPLDGFFVTPANTGGLRVLGVFGLHPDRMGFSVVEVAGPRPEALAREDGTPLFAPVLPGGAAAGLYSLVGAEELLELGWRTSAGMVPWTR